MQKVLEVRGLLEHIYEWLPAKDKKSLSETCKAARESYRTTWFPRGLKPAPIKLSVSAEWIGCHNKQYICNSCGIRSIAPNCAMGMLGIAKIGVLRYCKALRCRDLAIRQSYEHAVKTLILDEGTGIYVPPDCFYTLLERCIATSCSGLRCHAVRTAHDSIVNAMIKHSISRDNTSDYPCVHPPTLALKSLEFYENPALLLEKSDSQLISLIYVDSFSKK